MQGGRMTAFCVCCRFVILEVRRTDGIQKSSVLAAKCVGFLFKIVILDKKGSLLCKKMAEVLNYP